MKPLETDFVHAAKVEKQQHTLTQHLHHCLIFCAHGCFFLRKDFPRMAGALLCKQHLSQMGKKIKGLKIRWNSQVFGHLSVRCYSAWWALTGNQQGGFLKSVSCFFGTSEGPMVKNKVRVFPLKLKNHSDAGRRCWDGSCIKRAAG